MTTIKQYLTILKNIVFSILLLACCCQTSYARNIIITNVMPGYFHITLQGTINISLPATVEKTCEIICSHITKTIIDFLGNKDSIDRKELSFIISFSAQFDENERENIFTAIKSLSDHYKGVAIRAIFYDLPQEIINNNTDSQCHR